MLIKINEAMSDERFALVETYCSLKISNKGQKPNSQASLQFRYTFG